MDAMPFVDALKVVAPFVAPSIKSITDQFIIPGIKKAWETIGSGRRLEEGAIVERFEEYLLRYYAKLYYVNTLAFGGLQVKLANIYQPLTVVSRKQSSREIVINGWPDDFIPTSRKVLLVDTAGMGKSTILKWLFLASIDNPKRIPLYVELRSVAKANSVLDYLISELSAYDKPFPRELLVELLRRGVFTIFLDGFDEIDRAKKADVTSDLQDLVARNGENWYIIASRKESELNCFGDFEEFGIKGLKRSEAYELLRKYDADGECAERLIAELDDGIYDQISDLLKSPMLVSLIFKAYSYRPKVPFKKSAFYRQVYDALYEAHDYTKGGCFSRIKHSLLDSDDFHKVLRYLGYESMKMGKVEFQKDELLFLLDDIVKKPIDVKFKPSDFVRDLVESVPLFRIDGTVYIWAHKSVQDYFASQYICSDARGRNEQILNGMCASRNPDRYQNIFDILYDSDPQLFRLTITAYVLNKFEAFITPYETAEISGVDKADIFLRGASCFVSGGRVFGVVGSIVQDGLSKPSSPEYFKKMLELVKQAIPGYKFEARMSTLSAASNGVRVGIEGDQVRWLFIIKLLRQKGVDIFVDDRIGRVHSSPALIKDLIAVLGVDNMYPLDVRLDNLSNDVGIYKAVTGFICMGVRENLLFDYEKAKALKREIDEERNLLVNAPNEVF